MRLPDLTYEQLNARQRELYDRIASKRGQTKGPYMVWLRSPELADRVEALSAYARWECALPEKLRELSILMTARHWDAQFSWNAHAEKAINLGISRDAVEAIAEKRAPVFKADDERAFFNFGMELLEKHFVSDETFSEARAVFGEQGIVDIVGCVGNFSMLAMVLNAFQVDLQAGRKPPFPDVRGFEKKDA